MRRLVLLALLVASGAAAEDGRVWLDNMLRDAEHASNHEEVMAALQARTPASAPQVVYVPVAQPAAIDTRAVARRVCTRLTPPPKPPAVGTLAMLDCVISLDAELRREFRQ